VGAYDVETAMAEARARWADHVRAVSAPLTAWMLERLDLQPGQSVLDIAAGVGDPGFEVAELVGRSGQLISTDISVPAVDLARRRSRALGLANVRFQVMDAQRMGLPSESVDRALCRWGFMLMPDPRAALAETRRVVRAGGQLVLAVWGPGAENPWAGRVRRALEILGRISPFDQSAPGGMFSLPDEPTIRPLLDRAGWRMLELAEIRLTWRYRDFEAYWAYASETAGEAGSILAEMSAPELATVRGIVEEGSREFRDSEGYRYPALSLGVLAG
jgi:SAM-dependent methyltransferase